MANRSYLFATDRDPRAAEAGVRGVSEAASGIPVMHLLLVSENPVLVPSQIWEGCGAILADFEGGVQRSRRVFAELARRGSEPATSALADLETFVAENTSHRSHFLLEVVEIFELMGEDPVAGVEGLLRDIGVHRQAVDTVFEEFAPDMMRAIEGGDQGWFSEHLYFGMDSAFCGDESELGADLEDDAALETFVLGVDIKVVTAGYEETIIAAGSELPDSALLDLEDVRGLRFVAGEQVLYVPEGVEGGVDIHVDVQEDGAYTIEIFGDNDFLLEHAGTGIPVRKGSPG